MKVEFLNESGTGIYSVTCVTKYIPESRVNHPAFNTIEKEFVFNKKDKAVYIFNQGAKTHNNVIEDVHSFKLTNNPVMKAEVYAHDKLDKPAFMIYDITRIRTFATVTVYDTDRGDVFTYTPSLKRLFRSSTTHDSVNNYLFEEKIDCIEVDAHDS